MAREMKAVIRAEVDPSGVVRGVNAVNSQLDRLNRTASMASMATGVTAAFNTMQAAFAIGQRAMNAINTRVDDLMETTAKFDLNAYNAKVQSEIAKIQADKRIAAALGPAIADAFKEQGASALKEAARVESMRNIIGPGIVRDIQARSAVTAATNTALDLGTGAVGAATISALQGGGIMDYLFPTTAFGRFAVRTGAEVAKNLQSEN
jgi:hypothetical protein